MSNDRNSPVHTVKQLAVLAGVSVRTLHHYDSMGLLRPAHTGDNGYRYYSRPQLLRLQQIILHRRLGLSLSEIAAILDAPEFDQESALLRQKARLMEERDRFSQMIETIERTIATLKGQDTMSDAELYSGFTPPAKQAEYEAWLVEKYGSDAEGWIAEAKKRGPQDALQVMKSMEELRQVETALADQLRKGVASDDAALDPLLERHRAWIASQWGRPCPPVAYANMADIYQHPDFVKRYEAIHEGFTAFLTGAIRAWAKRQGV
jgi:DNA-binding transcriptional MerR regulator